MKLKKIWEKIVVLIYGGIPPGVLAKSCYEEFVAEYGWIYTEENNMMTEKRFTTVELEKPTQWGIWYDGAYLSTYQICMLLNEYVDVKKENEQLIKRNKELQKSINNFIELEEENEELKANCKNYEWYKKYKELLNENEQLKNDYITLKLQDKDRYEYCNELKKENEQLKKELQRIYDVGTINKAINVLEARYDKMLSDGSSEIKDAMRMIVLKCIEDLDEFKDDITAR